MSRNRQNHRTTYQWHLEAGFQMGPTFPYFFYAPYFSLFFLKMPYYPYFLVQKCLKWPKIVIFFFFFLAQSASSGACKNQIHLFWAAAMQKFIKYFYFSSISFFFEHLLWHYFSMVCSVIIGGWSGGAKVLCILHHWGVQLILAYSWARPAILVVGKGRGGMFLFLLFLHFHSCSSFFPVPLIHLLYSLFYLFSPFLWETTQNDPQGLTCR